MITIKFKRGDTFLRNCQVTDGGTSSVIGMGFSDLVLATNY